MSAKAISITERMLAEVQEAYLAMNRSWINFAIKLRNFHDKSCWLNLGFETFTELYENCFPGISKHTVCKILRITSEFSEAELLKCECASLDTVYDMAVSRGSIEEGEYKELKKQVFNGKITRSDLRSFIREKKNPDAPVIYDLRVTEHEARVIIKALQDSNKLALAIKVKAQSKSKRGYL